MHTVEFILSLRVLTDRGSCKSSESFCVMVSVSAVTHIRSTTQNVKYTPRGARGWGIDLSFACVIYEPSSPFRLHWPQKRNSHFASHSHRLTRWCPCVATSKTLFTIGWQRVSQLQLSIQLSQRTHKIDNIVSSSCSFFFFFGGGGGGGVVLWKEK